MQQRRAFLKTSSLGLVGLWCQRAFAQPTAPRLLLVHGRSQEGRNPAEIKTEWLTALQRGAHAAGVVLPANLTVDLPYYGNVLDGFARDAAIPLVSEVGARGSQDDEFLVFQAQVAESLREAAKVSDAQVDAEYGSNPKPRGPLNWEWVQAILRALDKNFGGLGQATLETFTRDVFLYSTRAGVRDAIDRIVSAALTTEPTVVVGHSLGTLVAYSVLLRETRHVQIPAFITVGSPLGIRSVRDLFRPLHYPPVGTWYNAFDPRDVVALYPLDDQNFPVRPAVENYAGVKNSTSNRHGISGYLDDQAVAGRVIGQLTHQTIG